MLTFIASIFIFSIVILFHEIGHYKAARSVGIKIEEFAIGMGPVIYKKERNDTLFSIRAFPIGGFVKMEGEEEDIKSTTSYSSKSVRQRAKAIAAGPLMNFVLAIILFLIVSLFYGVPGSTVEYVDKESSEYIAGLSINDKIIRVNDKRVFLWDDIAYEIQNQPDYYTIEILRDNEYKTLTIEQNYRKLIGITSTIENGETTTKLGSVDKNMPAYKAGIRVGDEIVKINNVEVTKWEDIRNIVNNTETDELLVSVNRDGDILEFNVVPKNQIVTGFYTKTEKNIGTSILSSVYKTIYYIKLMFYVVFKLITGEMGSESIAGPVGVINMVGEAAKLGLYPFLTLAGFISINLGFFNLLPIPALDGSKLAFLLYEGITKKKIPQDKEGFIHFVGFVLLLALMIMITYKDIIKLF